MNNFVELGQIVALQTYPMLFATVSGAHLYGFASPDSDYDLRGVHILPLPEIIGLNVPQETIEISEINKNFELDLVTHDLKKFCKLLLKRNGYVLEQLYSCLVIHTTPEHQELKAIAENCITCHHVHHYLGFAKTQWKLLTKDNTLPKVKSLLYLYRVLLTGIHLMQSGKIEANLSQLNQKFNLSYIPDLIAQKISGTEKAIASDFSLEFHEREYASLKDKLILASANSHLPDMATAKPALNDFLVRIRLNN
ncbi:MAG: nucleotidyltransferase domain-containing protein [Cyanobacteria bacterium P01_E01_bin.35]